MNAVFDSPVGMHCPAEFLCISRQAGNVVAGLTRRFVAYPPLGLDHSDAFEACLSLIWIRIYDEVELRDDPMPPSFDPPMAAEPLMRQSLLPDENKLRLLVKSE
jgi:hypothetical protein